LADMTIEELRGQFDREAAEATSPQAWKSLRDRWLARDSGIISGQMRRMRELNPQERPAFGKAINALRDHVSQKLEKALAAAKAVPGPGEALDVTRPCFPYPTGHEHPIRNLQREIERVFVSMGFQVFDLPEIEEDYNNFESLNMPEDHPARDAQDTFYLGGTRLLRTHCSTVQVHAMKRGRPPIRAVSTGQVYRRDPFDATHSPMFFQVDVLVVDRGISLAHLKGNLEVFLKQIFHPEIRMRFRPGYFPFVEPGAEVDISCIFCFGAGCKICKQSGWIEILGAGMVHPKVLRMGGIDDAEYSGFAWGMGIDRVAILKYGVDDIRLFFENDLRFLEQF